METAGDPDGASLGLWSVLSLWGRGGEDGVEAGGLSSTLPQTAVQGGASYLTSKNFTWKASFTVLTLCGH